MLVEWPYISLSVWSVRVFDQVDHRLSQLEDFKGSDFTEFWKREKTFIFFRKKGEIQRRGGKYYYYYYYYHYYYYY